ncbi:MAG: hypothetical protein KDA21_02180 [Phycisphaerales bacterium]|nr:hypothetical protein [Phycisphaerales bacterium]
MVRFILMLMLGLLAAPAPAERRPLDFTVDGQWIGAGISYGEYRDGQAPGGAAPSDDDLREDLHIIARHWRLLRMYGTRNAERVCRIITEDQLPLHVMVGAWITTEASEEEIKANRSEVAAAIRITNAHPAVVLAVNVGNETQVSWSGHGVPAETLIRYLTEVRDATTVPVTTCDDYNFWNKPESARVAAACDFMGLHAYAMWNGQTLDRALDWTRRQIDEIHALHPDLPIVLCETGWATQRLHTGDQGELIKGVAGENQQELYYRAFRQWAEENRLPHFYFCAFDENWKGGVDPREVEKHWGLYNADRTPKPAARPAFIAPDADS